MKVTQHLKIYGHVQGVFFRETMCRTALQFSVTGWVRNCHDGSVEAMVQGSREAVDLIIEWAKSGPEQARVEKMEISKGSGDYPHFEKLNSA